MKNDDPSFTALLQRVLQRPITPLTRRILYHAVCVPFRLGLFTLVFWFPQWLHIPARIFSVVAAVRLVLLPPGHQWWSRTWSIVCAIAATLAPTSWVYLPLYISVLGGVLQSFVVRFE